ncbi:hypothetical protein CKK33_14615 [Mucilaginibacter sp. MD40]|nr:hypothetical protein CKK33_14615 [Mucilaginibacter sp. MD40]
MILVLNVFHTIEAASMLLNILQKTFHLQITRKRRTPWRQLKLNPQTKQLIRTKYNIQTRTDPIIN